MLECQCRTKRGKIVKNHRWASSFSLYSLVCLVGLVRLQTDIIINKQTNNKLPFALLTNVKFIKVNRWASVFRSHLIFFIKIQNCSMFRETFCIAIHSAFNFNMKAPMQILNSIY
jgi:hypothetical protein